VAECADHHFTGSGGDKTTAVNQSVFSNADFGFYAGIYRLYRAYERATENFGGKGPQADTVKPKRDLQPGHTYWKVRIEDHDKNGNKIYTTYNGAIIDVWRCPERGICAALHSVDPHDEDMRKLASRVLKKAVQDVTDSDVLQFCGYQADLQSMEEKAPGGKTGSLGKWSGTINIRIKGLPGQSDPDGTKVAFVSTLHFNLEEIGGSLLHAQVYKGIPLFGAEADLIPVPNPTAGCIAPPPLRCVR
jgi:hypothetical protein